MINMRAISVEMLLAAPLASVAECYAIHREEPAGWREFQRLRARFDELTVELCRRKAERATPSVGDLALVV